MQKLLSSHAKVILLFFYIFNYNTLFSSEEFLALHNRSAQYFMQKFPSMTFPQAAQALQKLPNLTQGMIWHKINRKSFDDNNDILPTALGMVVLPLELQYAILSENFDILNKQTKEGIPQEAIDFLRTKSIAELFENKAQIDTACKNKDFLKIRIFSTTTIKLPKTFLFGASKDQIKIIKNTDIDLFSKKDLVLLEKLPKNLREKLNNHGYHRNIIFHYRHYRLTPKLLLKNFADILHNPVTIPAFATMFSSSLAAALVAHCLVAPFWDSITGSQNPALLEEATKKILSNALVDEIQKNQLVPNSEMLLKHTISEVPFEYSDEDIGTFFKPLLILSTPICPMTLLLLMPKEEKAAFKKLNISDKIAIMMSGYCIKFFSAITIASLIAYPYAKTIFEDGIFNGIGLHLVLWNLLAGTTITIMTAMQTYDLIDKTQEKYVNFNDNELIKQYLNDPSIKIEDF